MEKGEDGEEKQWIIKSEVVADKRKRLIAAIEDPKPDRYGDSEPE